MITINNKIQIRTIIEISTYFKNISYDMNMLKDQFLNEINKLIENNLYLDDYNSTYEISFCIGKLLFKYIELEEKVSIKNNYFENLRRDIIRFNKIINNQKYLFVVEITKLS